MRSFTAAARLTAAALMVAPLLATTVATAAAKTSAPATTSASTGVDDVYAITAGADGKTTNMAVYDPAPGVTPVELYKRLQQKGVKGLMDPSVARPMVARCGRWGSANTLYDGTVCNPAPSWARNGYPNPQIYYHDTSSSDWPVGTVISTWNNSPNIHVSWAPGGCPGYAGTHCVNVTSGDYPGTGWFGATYVTYDSQSHYLVDGKVYIELNDYYETDATQRMQAACHEVGHSFGLGHDTNSASCMYAGGRGPQPINDDYEEIINYVYPY